MSKVDAEERRISSFLDNHSSIVRIWLKHKVTDSAMDDVLKMHKANFTSWKGVRKAMFNHEGLLLSTDHMCSLGYEHMNVSECGVVAKFTCKDSSAVAKTVSPHWNQEAY